VRRLARSIVAVLALVLIGAMVVPTAGPAKTTARTATRTSSGRVMVLGYHAIAALDDEPVIGHFSVAPSRFAEHLDTLVRHGWTFVDLDAVLASLNEERDLPKRAVLLTFDDAYADLLDVVCPILEERHIPAVAFAVADRVGETNLWDNEHGAEILDLLDAEGLREIASRGIEIGSHTATHRHLPEVPAEELDTELVGSADRLESLGLPRPRAFSYPYGLWDRQLAKAVHEAGYELAFAVDRGAVENGCERYALPRVAVHADDSGYKLHLKLASAGWPKVVRGAARLAARARRAIRPS